MLKRNVTMDNFVFFFFLFLFSEKLLLASLIVLMFEK